MREIVYSPPNDLDIKNPPMKMLRELILEQDERYWCVGSGERGLTTDLGSDRVALSLVLKEPYASA